MSRATPLLRLQTIDSELDTLRARVREIETALGDSPAVQAAQRDMVEVQTRFEAARISERDLEHEEQWLAARRVDVEKRLYGGLVQNPKELQDLQKDLEMLKR